MKAITPTPQQAKKRMDLAVNDLAKAIREYRRAMAAMNEARRHRRSKLKAKLK